MKLKRFLQDWVLPRKLIELLRRASGSLEDPGNFSIDRSNAGERQALESLVSRLVPGPGYVIDIAASDGLSQSCTAGLFSSLGWRGLAVEMDPIKFSSLASTYSLIAGASLARTRITPSNASAVLQAFEVPANFSVLNLDIDSYDLRVLEKLLVSKYRPAIITMEINEKIPQGFFSQWSLTKIISGRATISTGVQLMLRARSFGHSAIFSTESNTITPSSLGLTSQHVTWMSYLLVSHLNAVTKMLQIGRQCSPITVTLTTGWN